MTKQIAKLRHQTETMPVRPSDKAEVYASARAEFWTQAEPDFWTAALRGNHLRPADPQTAIPCPCRL